MQKQQQQQQQTKRTKHESEIVRIRKEIKEADIIHKQQTNDLERTLLEDRMRVQRQADQKIQEMQNESQEKAEKFLSDHTSAL